MKNLIAENSDNFNLNASQLDLKLNLLSGSIYNQEHFNNIKAYVFDDSNPIQNASMSKNLYPAIKNEYNSNWNNSGNNYSVNNDSNSSNNFKASNSNVMLNGSMNANRNMNGNISNGNLSNGHMNESLSNGHMNGHNINKKLNLNRYLKTKLKEINENDNERNQSTLSSDQLSIPINNPNSLQTNIINEKPQQILQQNLQPNQQKNTNNNTNNNTITSNTPNKMVAPINILGKKRGNLQIVYVMEIPSKNLLIILYTIFTNILIFII